MRNASKITHSGPTPVTSKTGGCGRFVRPALALAIGELACARYHRPPVFPLLFTGAAKENCVEPCPRHGADRLASLLAQPRSTVRVAFNGRLALAGGIVACSAKGARDGRVSAED